MDHRTAKSRCPPVLKFHLTDSGDLIHMTADRHQRFLICHLFCLRIFVAQQTIRCFILLDLRESSHLLIETVIHVIVVALADFS